MSKPPIRMAVRAVIVHDGKLLLVNAWADGRHGLMCAPGGGAETGSSLPDNLMREVYEETGLRVEVGPPALVNEFHDPASGYHQVEVFFRCRLIGSAEIDRHWQDPENIVSKHLWVSQSALRATHHKPDSLEAVAFGDAPLSYDPLEVIQS